MIIRQLTEQIAVADQLELHDFDAVKAAGFQSVICNRPDDEGELHAESRDVEKLAASLGMEFRYLPVNAAQITDDDVKQHAQFLSELPMPILTYCRSGTRCARLWALSEAGKQEANDLMEAVEKAGLSIADMAPRLK